MAFTSYAFLGFLALVLLVYHLAPARWQQPLLLLASGAFCLAAGPVCLALILGLSVLTWAVGLRLSAPAARHKRAWLAAFLALAVGALAAVRYGGAGAAGLLGPVGISFCTFQAVGYVVDVYRGGQPAQRSLFKVALFLAFFPQLAQGPISRYGQLAPTLYAPHRFQERTFSLGLMRVLWGYCKKLVLADRAAVMVDAVYAAPAQYGGLCLAAATVLYAFQLYWDFSGGVDIALGVGQAMGIQLPENFARPYFSTSVRQFWRRWHITLGTWLRDYIYIPLGGSRRGKGREYADLMVVFLVSGLWHGAGWTFLVWGALHGLYLVLGRFTEPVRDRAAVRLGLGRESRLRRGMQRLCTFALVDFAWIFFRAPDMASAMQVAGGLFTAWDPRALTGLGLAGADWLVLAAGAAAALGVSLYESRRGSVGQALYEKPGLFYGTMAALLVCTVVFGAYGAGYDVSRFIYDRF